MHRARASDRGRDTRRRRRPTARQRPGVAPRCARRAGRRSVEAGFTRRRRRRPGAGVVEHRCRRRRVRTDLRGHGTRNDLTVVDRTPRSMVGRAVGVVRGTAAMAGWRPRPRGASALTYHDVTDDPANPTEQVTPAVLRAQLRAALHWGVRFVPLPDLCGRVLGGEPVDGVAAITFDDAPVAVYRSAGGVLSELDLPATVFVVSDRLGTQAPVWYPGSDRVMAVEELRAVAAAGFDVQSHTRTHPDLPSLTGVDLDRELA